MFVSICCKCKLVMGLKEQSSPGLLYSHGYCAPCGRAELVKISIYDADSKMLESAEAERSSPHA